VLARAVIIDGDKYPSQRLPLIALEPRRNCFRRGCGKTFGRVVMLVFEDAHRSSEMIDGGIERSSGG